ncbi:MAG: hypothetical protein JXA97_09465 [Anaerolineales bacterium]|nr:hypothetical protein [Anaerolineales bacterium]
MIPAQQDAHPALGPAVRVHPPRKNLLLRIRLLAIAAGIGAVVTSAGAFLRLYDAYQNYGPALISRWTSPLLAASGALWLFLILSILDYHTLKSCCATVYEGGIVIERNSRKVNLRWGEIEALVIKATRYLVPFLNRQAPLRLQIHSAGKKPLSIQHTLEDMPELIDTLKAQVYPRVLEECRRTLDQGGKVIMGPFHLSAAELRVGKRSIGWVSVRQVHLEKGRICLHFLSGKRTQTARIPAHKIPNVDLCIQIIHHLGQIS